MSKIYVIKLSFKLFMFGIYVDWDILNVKYNKIVKKWKISTCIIVIIFYVFFKYLLWRIIYWVSVYISDLEIYFFNIY